MLTHPRFVAIYVNDQQQALDFFTGTLGFELLLDAPFDQGRWIEVRQPGAETYLVLAPADPEVRSVVREHMGPMSHVWFDCDDLDATFEELRAKGVEFPVEPQSAPWDPTGNTRWAQFADPEGNVYGVSEQAS
jgi:catechol 2,3-dioxygenase-like lactoylglutathione lyase family enzyme